VITAHQRHRQTDRRTTCDSKTALCTKVHCAVKTRNRHRGQRTSPANPPYLADLIQFHTTPKSTRSSSSQLLFVPRHNLSFGSRAFRVSAPKVWNTLPLHTRHSQLLSTFRRHLKTHYAYFLLAYPATIVSIHQRALILFIQTLALYKINHLLTYLLTYFVGGY